MTARERLVITLANLMARSGFGPYSKHEEIAKRLVDEALGEHAHELAERIRNSKRLRDYTDDHMSDCYEAADEIDPEVGQ
ncbi:hypothetical protein J3S85_37775 [Streptomyces lavenduligriseus]|nr:hypothetical protein J3S85_37775 [Streptomyces lavenduligriseus]